MNDEQVIGFALIAMFMLLLPILICIMRCSKCNRNRGIIERVEESDVESDVESDDETDEPDEPEYAKDNPKHDVFVEQLKEAVEQRRKKQQQ